MVQRIYLMRHGQTRFNALGKIQGTCDSRLTAYGIGQAKAARQMFKDLGIEFDAVYCSPQERAADTASLVVDHSLPLQRVDGLRE